MYVLWKSKENKDFLKCMILKFFRLTRLGFFLILDTQGLEWEDNAFPTISKEAPTAQIEC